MPITFYADKKPTFVIGKLRNRKDRKHLRYFRNVCCVVTNSNKNKDALDQRVFSSLFPLPPPPRKKKKTRLLRTRNKLENHEGYTNAFLLPFVGYFSQSLLLFGFFLATTMKRRTIAKNVGQGYHARENWLKK